MPMCLAHSFRTRHRLADSLPSEDFNGTEKATIDESCHCFLDIKRHIGGCAEGLQVSANPRGKEDAISVNFHNPSCTKVGSPLSAK